MFNFNLNFDFLWFIKLKTGIKINFICNHNFLEYLLIAVADSRKGQCRRHLVMITNRISTARDSTVFGHKFIKVTAISIARKNRLRGEETFCAIIK